MRNYEVHKLAQETTQYGLSIKKLEDGVYISAVTLQLVIDLFLIISQKHGPNAKNRLHTLYKWERIEICKRSVEVSDLLVRFSYYLFNCNK